MSRLSRHSLSDKKRTGGQRGMLGVGAALAVLVVLTVLQGNNETTSIYLSSLQSSQSSSSSSSSSSNNNNDKSNADNDDFAMATYESYGFFTDIAAHDWTLMKQRVQDVYPNTIGDPAALKQNRFIRASDFYQDHYEPEFACRHERRVGKRGDGGTQFCCCCCWLLSLLLLLLSPQGPLLDLTPALSFLLCSPSVLLVQRKMGLRSLSLTKQTRLFGLFGRIRRRCVF